jgi:hypothetical protein
MEGSAMAINGMTAIGEAVNGDVHAWPHRRGVGRPSTVAMFAPQISAWLHEEPALSGAEVLRRARIAGYHGGKSALYELVRRLRLPMSASR